MFVANKGLNYGWPVETLVYLSGARQHKIGLACRLLSGHWSDAAFCRHLSRSFHAPSHLALPSQDQKGGGCMMHRAWLKTPPPYCGFHVVYID
jgi:hypothetical protein